MHARGGRATTQPQPPGLALPTSAAAAQRLPVPLQRQVLPLVGLLPGMLQGELPELEL